MSDARAYYHGLGACVTCPLGLKLCGISWIVQLENCGKVHAHGEAQESKSVYARISQKMLILRVLFSTDFVSINQNESNILINSEEARIVALYFPFHA